MNIIDNIYDALVNTTELTFLVLSNMLLLVIVMYMAVKRPDKRIRAGAAILFLFSLFITVPLAFNMFFK